MGSPVEAVGGQIVIGDLLLTWISESGSGKIIDLRARAGWLMRTEDLGPSDSATNQWLRDAASLGHCEVDWKRGTWSVAPPIVTRLNLSDGLAILVGARRPRLIRALDEAGVYFESARRPGSPRDFPVPSTILIPYEQICDLEQAAIAIGARFSGCAASGIAAMLEQPALTTPAVVRLGGRPLRETRVFRAGSTERKSTAAGNICCAETPSGTNQTIRLASLPSSPGITKVSFSGDLTVMTTPGPAP